MRIAHQDLLFCLQAHLVEGRSVIAIAASALGTAEPVVREALAVEFQTARLAAIAGLVLTRGHLRLLRRVPHRLHQRILEGSVRVFLHVYIVAVDVNCLRERCEVLASDVRVRALSIVLFVARDGREDWDWGERVCSIRISFVSFRQARHLRVLAFELL